MVNAWHRREVVLGGLLTFVPNHFCCASAQGHDLGGCWLNPAQTESFTNSHNNGPGLLRETLVARSDVEHLDAALVITLQRLSTLFGVLPSFSYYREHDRPNAKATSRDLVGDRSDGTVLLGTQLLAELLTLPAYGDAAIVAVCAHEFGHILSYSNGMIRQLARGVNPSRFPAEQFADFMSGYYAGVLKRADPDYPAVIFADSTSRYGDVVHGTGEQRARAVVAGFKRAYYGNDQPVTGAAQGLAFAMESKPN